MFDTLVTYAIHQTATLPPNDALAYQYVLAANGVFIRSATRFWDVTMPLVRGRIRGLQRLRPSFQLRVPRLPQQLLAQVLADAQRTQGSDGRLQEALYYFYHSGERIRVVKPAQRATAVRVSSPGGDDPAVILELHSHGSLAAFWSSVDDGDEQGGRLYGVIGRLDGIPEIRLRLGVYGYHWPLPVTVLFDGPGGLVDLTTNKGV